MWLVRLYVICFSSYFSVFSKFLHYLIILLTKWGKYTYFIYSIHLSVCLSINQVLGTSCPQVSLFIIGNLYCWHEVFPLTGFTVTKSHIGKLWGFAILRQNCNVQCTHRVEVPGKKLSCLDSARTRAPVPLDGQSECRSQLQPV